MKTAAFQKRKGYLVMGGGGLVAAAVYLGLSFRLPFGEMDQPGAAVFPVVVGVILMLGEPRPPSGRGGGWTGTSRSTCPRERTSGAC